MRFVASPKPCTAEHLEPTKPTSPRPVKCGQITAFSRILFPLPPMESWLFWGQFRATSQVAENCKTHYFDQNFAMKNQQCSFQCTDDLQISFCLQSHFLIKNQFLGCKFADGGIMHNMGVCLLCHSGLSLICFEWQHLSMQSRCVFVSLHFLFGVFGAFICGVCCCLCSRSELAPAWGLLA